MGAPEPAEDRWGVRAVCVISVVAARKVDFAAQAVERYRKLLRSTRKDVSLPSGTDGALDELIKLIGRLDWRLFVTPSELAGRKLNPQTVLEDLDRAGIWSVVDRQLGNLIGPG
jgi:hypothetical protein